MDKTKVLETVDEIKAFSDPYRLKILYTFKKLGKPSTVKQIGDALGEVPAKVHYHVKKLEAAGVLRLVYTEEVNGIVAKFYEPTADSFTIKSKELNPDVNKLVLNETQKVIASIYDESKKMLLDNMQGPDIEDENCVESIRSSRIYLTDDNARELDEYIENFLREKGKKESELRGTDGFRKYHVFNVILPINGQGQK